MLAAGVAELQTDLRKYLACVRKGQDVVITEHGKPVARLIAAKASPESLEQRLLPLVKAGIVRLPSQARSRRPVRPPVLKGTPLSEIAIESRR